MISIATRSCVLCRTYADCWLFDVMKWMCSLNLNSSEWSVCPMHESLYVWHFSC